jgi:hypothetical protein
MASLCALGGAMPAKSPLAPRFRLAAGPRNDAAGQDRTLALQKDSETIASRPDMQARLR